MTEEMVSIPKRKYEYLLKQEQILNALQAAGVDNWEGYEEAVESVNSIDEPNMDEFEEQA